MDSFLDILAKSWHNMHYFLCFQLGDFQAFRRPLGDQFCPKSPLKRLWSPLGDRVPNPVEHFSII